MAITSYQHPEPDRPTTLRRVVPFVWLALSATWAVVIVVTDLAAWPLAVWIAITVGPVTAVERRRSDHTTTTNGASSR